MNILFICKYNRFRSKVAEAYFNKIAKGEHLAKSAGLISGFIIDKEIFNAIEKAGLKISPEPVGVSYNLFMWADKTIIIADNILISTFDELKRINNKEVIQWEIKDVEPGENRDKTINQICNKVDDLIKSLNDSQ